MTRGEEHPIQGFTWAETWLWGNCILKRVSIGQWHHQISHKHLLPQTQPESFCKGRLQLWRGIKEGWMQLQLNYGEDWHVWGLLVALFSFVNSWCLPYSFPLIRSCCFHLHSKPPVFKNKFTVFLQASFSENCHISSWWHSPPTDTLTLRSPIGHLRTVL